MEIGRARLRALAPDWTDHNAHDPGITLMELLAWTCEAQLYSLSHVRRDERTAFAALFGLNPVGMRAAQGLLWPDRTDPNSPALTYTGNVSISDQDSIYLTDSDAPAFRAAYSLMWTPGRIVSLKTRDARGQETDCTQANQRVGTPFPAFGPNAQDTLVMSYECRDHSGLLGSDARAAKSMYWSIGVRSASATQQTANDDDNADEYVPPVEVTLVVGKRRLPMQVTVDTSRGLQQTGVLLIDLAGVTIASPRRFTLELRPIVTPAVPPRIVRIEPNVIPIRQDRLVVQPDSMDERQTDWSIDLLETGLAFSMNAPPVTVEMNASAGAEVWTQRDDLTDCGPDDKVFMLDLKRRHVHFGNGINGQVPEVGAEVTVSYTVSDGDKGNTAANRGWRVRGFEGTFGVNLDPISGGAAASGLLDNRRDARRRLSDEHPLVTQQDILNAAGKLPFLDVSRAWILPRRNEQTPFVGTVTLIAMCKRPGDVEPAAIPETPRWLGAVRRGLAGRMLLGSRLLVTAPRYIGFSIQAVVEAKPSRQPKAIKDAIKKELRRRLALTKTQNADGAIPRALGVGVTSRDVSAWIRSVDGIGRVVSLKFLHDAGHSISEVKVPRNGLPRWNAAESTITVNRPQQGGRR